jgi:GNAT superfamily N-acetyltransferase
MLDTLTLPATLDARIGHVTLRRASAADLDPLMALLSDDPVSAARGDFASDAGRPIYLGALERVIASPSNDLLVVTDAGQRVMGTMQLTLIPGMARQGSTRLLVEAVRVHSDSRSSGIGSAMMRWVTDIAAPALDASLVQLTSDAARIDAHRFYERLGFVASHVGFKYSIPSSAS